MLLIIIYNVLMYAYNIDNDKTNAVTYNDKDIIIIAMVI